MHLLEQSALLVCKLLWDRKLESMGWWSLWVKIILSKLPTSFDKLPATSQCELDHLEHLIGFTFRCSEVYSDSHF